MKIFRILFILFFIGINMKSNAQEWTSHQMLNVAYTYQNHHFGELGTKILFLKDDNVLLRAGGGLILGSSTGNKIFFMPKIEGAMLFNFQRKVDIFHSYYYFVGIDVATKYIAPKLGISLFGIMDFTAGYGFSIDKEGIKGKELKGLNLGISFNIPTSVLF